MLKLYVKVLLMRKKMLERESVLIKETTLYLIKKSSDFKTNEVKIF